MAKKVRIQMSNAGVQAMLKSPGVQGLVDSSADRIATRAGTGYAAKSGTRSNTRARAFVVTETFEAMKDNARNATLLRAMGGG